ncbi:MAG: hypothetical protein M1832_004661 [Thelocarpon impressellum]|nr:MAG: hypothetical protein M1832_004661 [Thelocarpon impressellum]
MVIGLAAALLRRADENKDGTDGKDGKDDKKDEGGVSSVGVFFIVVAFLLLAAVVGWIVAAHLRARRLGLPPPTLASFIPGRGGRPSSGRNYPSGSSPGAGVMGWVTDKLGALKNRRSRTAGGAYEEPLSGARGRPSNRGHAALDPDEAWDTRVGTDADAYGPGGYYEEQELGLHTGASGPYGGGGYGGGTGPGAAAAADPPTYGDDEVPRGRSRSREPTSYGGGTRFDGEGGPAARQNPFGDQAERSDLSLRGVSPRPMEAEAQHDPASPTERRSIFREHST